MEEPRYSRRRDVYSIFSPGCCFDAGRLIPPRRSIRGAEPHGLQLKPTPASRLTSSKVVSRVLGIFECGAILEEQLPIPTTVL